MNEPDPAITLKQQRIRQSATAAVEALSPIAVSLGEVALQQ